jgi:hypothetical protein
MQNSNIQIVSDSVLDTTFRVSLNNESIGYIETCRKGFRADLYDAKLGIEFCEVFSSLEEAQAAVLSLFSTPVAVVPATPAAKTQGRKVKTAYGTMSAEKTVNNQYNTTYTVAAPCGTFIGTVEAWTSVNDKKIYTPDPACGGRVYTTCKTLSEACTRLASAFYKAQRQAQEAAEIAEIEAQDADQIAAEQVAAEQELAPETAPAQAEYTAVKAGRFHDIFEAKTGANLGCVEATNGVFRACGRAFSTLEKAANYLAKQVQEARQIEYENGSALADLQAQTECEAYCARAFEEELEREQATRQMYEQAPAYAPKKVVLGRADGTAKIVLDTGESIFIPAQKLGENSPKA